MQAIKVSYTAKGKRRRGLGVFNDVIPFSFFTKTLFFFFIWVHVLVQEFEFLLV